MNRYICVKDYCPIIHKTTGKVEPTDTPVIFKGDVLIETPNGVFKSTKNPDIALYKHTIEEYKECFKKPVRWK